MTLEQEAKLWTSLSTNDRYATFNDLPNELVNMIGEFLETQTQLSMIRACVHAHRVISRLLYRTVKLSKHRARRFFVTILSGSASSHHYPTYVTALEYSATNLSDAHLTFPLLTHALLALSKLRSLSLNVPTSASSFLLYLMDRDGIIRTASSLFKTIRPIVDTAKLVVPYNLSSLSSLCVDGNISLVSISRYRPLKELEIKDVIDFHDLSVITEYLTTGHGKKNQILERLSIDVDTDTNDEISYCLLGLASTFPLLKSLEFKAVHINALVRPYSSLWLPLTYHLPIRQFPNYFQKALFCLKILKY